MFDTLFHHGTILTMDSAQQKVESLAVAQGRIAAVGNLSDLMSGCDSRTQIIDLAGSTLLPGFNDAHVHVWKLGQLETSIADLREASDLAEVRAALESQRSRLASENWLLGRGFNELRLAERRLPTREDLDAWFPGQPVFITRTCGHIAVANSPALQMAGIHKSTMAPPGGEIRRDNTGQPSGILTETALQLVQRVIPVPSANDYRAMIRAASRHQLARGITSATDPGVEPTLLQVYRELAAEEELVGRYNVMTLAREGVAPTAAELGVEKVANPHLRIDTVKFFMDGGLSGATAALSQPYRDSASSGVLRWEEEQFFAQALQYQQSGWRIAVHVIGDRAISLALRVFSQLSELPSAKRHRLEHFGLPTPEDLRTAAALRTLVVTQPTFLYSLGANFRTYLPDDFPITPYPFRSMWNAGIEVALSSDAPVVSDDPWLGIQSAVMRRDNTNNVIGPDEAITIAEALRSYTLGGALASGDEQNRGTLQPGKWADMIVLSENPLTIPTEELTQIRVDRTYVGGTLVFEA